MDQIEGRNPVIECFTRKRRRVHKVWLDRGAKPDPRIDTIVTMCRDAGVPIEAVERRQLDAKAEGRVHNGVIAFADPIPEWSMKELLAQTYARTSEPLLLLVDAVAYEHNLGAILRSSLGFGVDGVILPTRRGAPLSPLVQRVAMGAAEDVPVVRESATSAMAVMRREGVRLVGADARGTPITEADLSGPLCIAVGAEGEGLAHAVKQRCDLTVSIPLAGGLESLNVSVATALVLYEKRRRDGWYAEGGRLSGGSVRS